MTALLFSKTALFTRALRSDVRSAYSTWIRAGTLIVLLLAILIADFDDHPAPGLKLLANIAIVNMLGLTLYALGSFPTAITEEKEDDTLGLILLTRLGPYSILLGKYGARLAGAFLFLSVQLPFLIVCIALGGVAIGQILHVYSVLCAYSFFLASCGLLVSVVSRNSARAVTVTFIIGLLVYVLPFFVWFSQFQWNPGAVGSNPASALAGFLVRINPLADIVYSLAGRAGFPFRVDSIGFHIAGGCLCLVAARLLFEKFSGSGALVSPRSVRKARNAVPQHPRAWMSALAWKDFYFLTGGRRGLAARFCLYSLLLAVLFIWRIYNGDYLTEWESAQTIRSTASVMFAIELAVAASRIFGSERSGRTLSSVFILPKSVAQFSREKITGGAMGLLSSAGIWLLGFLVTLAALRDPDTYQAVSRGLSGEEAYTPGIFALLGLTAMDVHTISYYVLVSGGIAYLSLTLRRGALMTGLGAALVGYLLVSACHAEVVARYWSTNSKVVEILEIETRFYLAAAVVTLLLAAVVISCIPRRLAACATEG